MTTVDGELRALDGHRPGRVGDWSIEAAGAAPVPASQRYGPSWRMLALWCTPNIEVSGLFIGSIAGTLGLGFRLGLASILVGSVLGTIPVAVLCAWGPRTGTPQMALARMPFGKSIILVGSVQWLSAVSWTALVALFGAEAAHLLLGVPFWLAAVIVLLAEGTISILGIERILSVQLWFALPMLAFFIIMAVRILGHPHLVAPPQTVHGGAAAGAFVLMLAIVLSGSISWVPYASDYSRYLNENTRPRTVFWYTMVGSLGAAWIAPIGLIATSAVGSNQTAAGVRTLMGGTLGDIAMVAIILGAVLSCCMNDYSAALSFQAAGGRVKRPIASAVAMTLGLGAVLWMNAASTASRFEDLILFAGYWISPFLAIVLIDWAYNKKHYTAAQLRETFGLRHLASGWPALTAFGVGFVAMLPFMDNSLVYGFASRKMDGADLAYLVGFIVAGVLFFLLRKVPAARRAEQTELAGQASALSRP
jgi:nucleobase:cation symporter-1, NCS1 family